MDKELDKNTESIVLLLLNWRRRAIRASTGHYLSSNKCRHWSNILTCFNIGSAIAVLFFTNNKFFINNATYNDSNINILSNSDLYTAIAGLLVVLTTALQYVLKLEIKTKDAKSAGNDFTNIKREIELLLSEDEISLDKARSIQISHSHTSKNHELVPKNTWKAASAQIDRAFLEDKEFESSIMRKFKLPVDSVSLLSK